MSIKKTKICIKSNKFSQKTRKIRQNTNKKSARAARKNEKFEKIFPREKNFDFLSLYERDSPYPIGPVMLLVLVWAGLQG